MVSLDRLPNEVLHGIASFISKKHDLAAFSRSNRHCYQIANPILWKREVRSDRPGALHWAVDHGDDVVFRRALDAGVSPSRMAFSHKPKSRIESKYKWWNYHSSYYDDHAWRIDEDLQSVDLDPSYVLHDDCNWFEGGCDDGIFNDCYWEPIHIAASKGRIDMIEALLDKGASVDASSWGMCLCRPHLPIEAFSGPTSVDEGELEDLHGGGWTPLHIAICHGQIDAAIYLLKRGASIVIYRGDPLELDLSAWQGEEEMPDAARFRLTAMHDAAKHGQVQLLQYLLDMKYVEAIHTQGPFMGTPLIQAVWYGHWDTVVPWLLKNGASIDTRLFETRLTPLMMACFSRRFDDAAKLIDLGASVTAMSMHQFSILHLILDPGQASEDEPSSDAVKTPKPTSTISETELIQKLLDKGLPVDSREVLLGMTPLMIASACCNLSAMEVLISAGADVNALDHDGLTALFRAGEAADDTSIYRLCDAGRILLDAGARLTSAADDPTPLNIICARPCDSYATSAWAEQHALLAKLFVEHGADPNAKGISTSRPFTTAVSHGNFTLAKAILECGGRPEPKDVELLLTKAAKDMYDDGKVRFLVNLDYAKYEITGPSDAFLVKLVKDALTDRLWSRVADLIKAVPVPKEMREGLLHRCLQQSSLTGDDPSGLVQVLLDMGEEPNTLWNGEPPIYYSLKCGYCWRSTPVLIKAGADLNMKTESMPDGAFIYSVNQGYQAQTLQMLVMHPDLLRDKPDRLHRDCWASVFGRESTQGQASGGRGAYPGAPFMYWNLAKRLLTAGLRYDIELSDGRDVKEAVEEVIPRHYRLGMVEREVLNTLGIAYEEPPVLSEEEDEDDGYSELDDEAGVLDAFGEEDEEEEGLWDDDDFESDEEEDENEIPMPFPLVFGFYPF